MPYCIQCGKELHHHAKFCYYCGAKVPNAEPAPSVEEPAAPDAPLMPEPAQAPDQTITASAKKRSAAQTVGYAALHLFVTLFVGLFVFATCYMAGPRRLDAKAHAKEEVEAAWQEFDENMELVSITYDPVKVDKWDEEEIEAYVSQYGNTGITDVDGIHYDTFWDYWNSKGYDPYTDTYRILTVKGNYRVTDRRKQDYKGWYCVTVLYIANENSWRILETELELPEELKQLLP